MQALIMRSQFQYIRPKSLREALDFLREHGPETSVFAGGTDLMIGVRKGEVTSRYAMDISRLEELRGIEESAEFFSIGAAVTYTEIVRSSVVQEKAPVLALAARSVGSVQIRNVGTLGGNVANASPAADSVPAMLVLNAKVRIQSGDAQRVEPLSEVIVGPYKTTLDPDELITAFLLDSLDNRYRSDFQRIARRRALAIARMNVAVAAQCRTDGRTDDVRLSVGSVTPQPCRMTAAEQCLEGTIPNRSSIQAAAEAVSATMVRKSGVRASTEYKRPAVEGLVTRVLSKLFLEEVSGD
jgi:CO/xanthine dehydrogenase FAD-binding subunit